MAVQCISCRAFYPSVALRPARSSGRVYPSIVSIKYTKQKFGPPMMQRTGDSDPAVKAIRLNRRLNRRATQRTTQKARIPPHAVLFGPTRLYSGVVPVGISCPARAVATVMLRDIDRVRGRALGVLDSASPKPSPPSHPRMLSKTVVAFLQPPQLLVWLGLLV